MDNVKPLTQAEIIRTMLRNHRPATRPTVTLKTNAKGEVQIEVTAYGKTAADAGSSACVEFDRIRDRYRLEELITHEDYDAAVKDGVPFD